MMKAYIHLEFTRTASFVTVRQLEQEKESKIAIRDSGD